MLRIAVLGLVLPLGLMPWLAWGCSDLGRARYEPRTFLGYACPDDCERHKAGFAWAERHQVTAAESCAALGGHEAEGCRAYVEEAPSVEEAGYRWAGENEIEHQCDCDGAGQRFRAGCLWGSGGHLIPTEPQESATCRACGPSPDFLVNVPIAAVPGAIREAK